MSDWDGLTEEVEVPAAVRRAVGVREARLVWRNDAGGLTFDAGDLFVKWAPTGCTASLRGEPARMRWAQSYTPVPVVVDHGLDDEGEWLVTARLAGESAVSPRWLGEPRLAVRAIGTGLRAFHDALPVATCPFRWDAATRLADARARAVAGRVDPQRWFPEHRHLSVAEALARAADTPAIDRLVVCHGDACAPNTLIDDSGAWAGHVDLGTIGVADRWADLAVATWSTQWNYGPGWESELLDAYGVAADVERIGYYRLLWELGP